MSHWKSLLNSQSSRAIYSMLIWLIRYFEDWYVLLLLCDFYKRLKIVFFCLCQKLRPEAIVNDHFCKVNKIRVLINIDVNQTCCTWHSNPWDNACQPKCYHVIYLQRYSIPPLDCPSTSSALHVGLFFNNFGWFNY